MKSVYKFVILLVAPALFVLSIPRERAKIEQFSAPKISEQVPVRQVDEETRSRVRQTLEQLPAMFIANHGQTTAETKYYTQSGAYRLDLTTGEAVFTFTRVKEQKSLSPQSTDTAQKISFSSARTQTEFSTSVVRRRWLGANPNAQLEGSGEQPGKHSFIRGNNPKDWQADVPAFDRVFYRNIYAGIDAVYYGNEGLIEYDYIIAPQTDPALIRWRYEGASNLRIDEASGDLIVGLPALEDDGQTSDKLIERAPVAWQDVSGKRVPVEARFEIAADGSVGFALGAYNPAHELTIDPKLTYSSYYNVNIEVAGIAIDGAGRVFVAGTVRSTNPNLTDLAFIYKISQQGNSLEYSLNIDGSATDTANGLAVDAAGHAYLAGFTSSPNFPATNAPDPTFNGPRSYMAKINLAGNGFVYNTFFGRGGDEPRDAAVDNAGNVYAAGVTSDAESNNTRGWVAKLNSSGAVVFNHLIQTNGNATGATDLAVDNQQNVFVTGLVDFVGNPLPGQPPINPGNVLAIRLNAAGEFVYQKSFGGAETDIGKGIATDNQGNAYISATTASSEFPTMNPLPGNYQCGADGATVAVMKLSPAGQILFSTCFGTVAMTGGIALDARRNIYLTGYAGAGFPTLAPYQAALGDSPGCQCGAGDAVVVKLKAQPENNYILSYSTYLGGIGEDIGQRVVVDADNNLYVTGTTRSTNFPLLNPFSTLGSPFARIGFVTRFVEDIIINSDGDQPDANLNDENCDADLTAAENQCTLRAAIQTVNNIEGKSYLSFRIPGGGVPSIKPASALPALINPVDLDATTQPGSMKVEIDGTNAGANVNGLRLTGGNSRVRGITVNRFSGHGILLETNGNNTIESCLVGTNPDATAALGNGRDGVRLNNIANNNIGGNAALKGNVISGNAQSGIMVDGSGAQNNFIQNNLIGVNASGTAALGNFIHGIHLRNASSSVIGGGANILTGDSLGNVIGGNNGDGIFVEGSLADANFISGNSIGLPENDTINLANSLNGIRILNGSANSVGSSDGNAPNVVGNNLGDGIKIEGSLADANTIAGNIIGLNSAGRAAAGNNQNGVSIVNARDNFVGSNTESGGNLIGSNGFSGVSIEGAQATGNKILGNRIGNTSFIEDAEREEVRPNSVGITIDNAPNNFIGMNVAPRNIISGNTTEGVLISGQQAAGNKVFNNIVGTKKSGQEALPNGGNGVKIFNAPNNLIGDAASETGNLISGNVGAGVLITGQTAAGNKLQRLIVGANPETNLQISNLIGIKIDGAPDNFIGTAAQGNIISGNIAAGVVITGTAAANNRIFNNHIGTNEDGTAILSNGGDGVLVDNAPANHIGGTGADEGNVISGNAGRGIVLSGIATSGNRLAGNYVGVNAAGNGILPNAGNGIVINEASVNQIGAGGGRPNVVTGNMGNGILITGSAAVLNKVENCLVGLDANGQSNLGGGNNGNGILLTDGARDNQIGTPNGTINVISGNQSAGVSIEGATTRENTVQNNVIGLTRDGLTARPNQEGVYILLSPGNVIGTGQASNLISSNTGAGVKINGAANTIIQNNVLGTNADAEPRGNGVGITLTGAQNTIIGGTRDVTGNFIFASAGDGIRVNVASNGTKIFGNYIGYDDGATLLGNGGNGIFIDGVSNCLIGGLATGQSNLIKDNAGYNIRISGTNGAANGNVIQNNGIGVDEDLETVNIASLGGILLENASNTTIGGATLSQGNVIGYNNGKGVNIIGGAGNEIKENLIAENASLGIDLGGDGVTPNDPNDPDAGANNLQNYPIFTAASYQNGRLHIEGSINTTPNTTVRLSFLGAAECDSSGNGSGGIPLGSMTKTTDAGGNAVFIADLNTLGVDFSAVTALATNTMTRDSSEFSPCRTVAGTATQSLNDDFESNQRNIARWNIGTLSGGAGFADFVAADPLVTVKQENGRLIITPRANVSGLHFNGYTSALPLDLTDALARVEVVQIATGGAETIFALGTDADNYLRFYTAQSAGVPTLFFESKTGGSASVTNIAYNPAQHRFWQLRHDSQTDSIVCETSADGLLWTEQRTAARPFAITALTMELSAGTSSAVAQPGQAIFDNVIFAPNNSLRFSVTDFVVSENGNSATATVIRTGGNTAATVDFATSNGTATSGEDYVAASGTLSFGVTESSKTISVQILNDLLIENSETFNLTLANPTGGARVVTPTATTVTITDNDLPTASGADLGGQIKTIRNQPLAGVRLSLLTPDGQMLSAQTDTEGFYRFVDVPTGFTYVITLSRKGFTFNPPNAVVTHLTEQLNLNFSAQPVRRSALADHGDAPR